jgi:iron only hydrogenase large subunit-like protein
MEDNQELIKILKTINKEKTICLLAPSFVVDFKYPKIIIELRRIGLKKIVELTYSAKLISKEIHSEIIKNKKKQYICANCPSVVKYIENKYPNIKKKIMDIASPMVLMGRFMKQKYPKYKVLFIGPCISKKQEAKENPEVDFAITFKETLDIIQYAKKNGLYIKKENEKKQFDQLYNDYTKIYPLSGAVAETINNREILSYDEIIVADGILEIDRAILKFKNNKKIRFLDMLFCKGGCVGGPGIISTETLDQKEDRVIHYRDKSKKEKLGKHLGKFKYAGDLNLKRKKS